MDPKNLEILEGMGGVGAILRGFGTHPNHSLSIETRTPILLWRASLQPETMRTLMFVKQRLRHFCIID